MNSLTLEWAWTICEMSMVCYSESNGPDDTDILKYIARTYPELVEEFPAILKP